MPFHVKRDKMYVFPSSLTLFLFHSDVFGLLVFILSIVLDQTLVRKGEGIALKTDLKLKLVYCLLI